MITENKEVIKMMNESYPKESHANFEKLVEKNWIKFNTEKDCVALKLYRFLNESKPPGTSQGYKIKKKTAFFLWLFLCYRRPWEKNRRLTWKECENKIWFYLPAKENFDIQNFRRLSKRPDFNWIITLAAWSPKYFKDIGQKSYRLLEVVEFAKKSFSKINLKQIRFLEKFIHLIDEEKYIKKIDLMRKLGINKKTCELYLKEGERQGLLKVISSPGNPVWIIQNKPKEYA